MLTSNSERTLEIVLRFSRAGFKPATNRLTVGRRINDDSRRSADTIRPRVAERISFEEVAEAHRRLEHLPFGPRGGSCTVQLDRGVRVYLLRTLRGR